MKKITLTLLLLFSVCIVAQQGINYKAVIKDGSGAIAVSTAIDVSFIILDGAVNVYEETHAPSTDANGVVILNIGEGTPVTGTFSAIDWSSNNHFLNVQIDTGGGLQDMGTTAFKTVHYALHAKTVSSITETDPSVPAGTTIGQMQYWNGTAWVTVASGNHGQILSFINGVPTWTNPGGPTEVQNPTTGKIWMDRNLGAIQVATSYNVGAAYGDLYQWGRGADGHQLRTSTTTTILSSTDTPGHGDFITTSTSPNDWRSPQNDNLWQGINGVNNPCPLGYRLPTDVELNAERLSWSSNNAAGAFASPLKLPLAGFRGFSDGLNSNVGSSSHYWSSTIIGNNSRFLDVRSDNASQSSGFRANGLSVRCIKD